MAAPWTSSPLTLAVTALAVHRLTRVVTRDDMPALDRARDRVDRWIEDRAPGYGEIVHCAWCTSIWLALAAVAGAELADRAGHRHAWLLACAPWAISSVVGIAADREVA